MQFENPYADLQTSFENPYEDLTVNTQEADMLAQQQQQSLANTMSNLQGAAGGSGIAALAQYNKLSQTDRYAALIQAWVKQIEENYEKNKQRALMKKKVNPLDPNELLDDDDLFGQSKFCISCHK